VGRLAYSLRDRVNIVPLHYVLDDRWLFFRTAEGAKMDVIRRSPWVAFEVDEVDGPFDWRSVVVHGTVYPMEPGGPPVDQEVHARALERLRTATWGAYEKDPVPFRTIVFGLHVDDMNGREAASRPRRTP
jgi:nitroimidazol reductase NimA-like FMN-containing flavoprotein (pyridoxamine 5'-phosphate oxidase superfamily)